MSVKLWRLGAVSMLALSSALGTPAAAQSEGVFTLLGRIILGAGRARVAIDTPQAVTALESEDLEREQAGTQGELLRAVPGVLAWGGGSMVGQLLNVRGIGTFSQSDENRIIVTIDGVPKYNEQYNMGSQFGEPDLYRRAEVLRGPASSLLYGAGAIGGVVAFETRDASDFLTEGVDTALRLRASGVSNSGGYSASGMLAHRFNDRFEVLAALTTRHDGPIEPGGGAAAVTATRMDAQSALFSGRVQVSDNGESLLRFSVARWYSDGIGMPYSASRNQPTFGLVDRTIDDRTYQVTWENPASDNPWLDARVQLSFSDTSTQQRNATGIPGFVSPLFQDADYAYQTLRLDARNTVEASGEGWQNFLTFGATVSRLDRQAQTFGAPALPLTFHTAGRMDSQALYLQNELVWNDRLTLLAALRYDRAQSVALAGPSAPFLNIPVTQDGTSASLAAHYRINDAWSVFGSAAETTRLPSIDELFSYQAPRISSFGTLRPERARSYEIGLSWQGRDLIAAGDGLDVKVTAFRNAITDRIVTGPVGAGLPNYVNTAQSRIQGLELEAAYQSELWFGRLAASLIDGRNVLTGATLTSTPAPQVMLEIGRRLPRQDLEFGWRGTLTGGMQYPDALGFVTVPGTVIHDLFLTWRPAQGVLRGATVQLSVNNLTDAYYFNALDVAANGYAGAFPQRGRDVRLTLGRTFNF